MQVRISKAITAITIAAVFMIGGAWCRTPKTESNDQAERKVIANADVVRMVKAGLSQETILLAIRKGPTNFDTSPTELISLKEQGVPEAVLHAMLTAAEPAAPAQPAPEQPPAAPAQVNTAPETVWVVFYGVCPQGGLIYFRPTIYANQRELARLVCNTFFYTVAQPGTYKFCATKGKCSTAVLRTGSPYYFRILPTTFSYNIAQVPAAVGEAEIRDSGLAALDSKQFLAPDLVTIDGDRAPPSVLTPQ